MLHISSGQDISPRSDIKDLEMYLKYQFLFQGHIPIVAAKWC